MVKTKNKIFSIALCLILCLAMVLGGIKIASGRNGVSAADYIVVIIGIILMLFVSIVFYKNGNKKRLRDILVDEKPAVLSAVIIAALIFVIIIFGAYGVGYDSGQFIYNQF